MKYAIELSAYGIQFQPRETKKVQVIVDFIVEYTSHVEEEEAGEDHEYVLHVDGSST